MIADAVLYLATADDASAALHSVAGRPLAFRAIVAAIRAGFRRVMVPVAFRGTAVERAIATTPSARAATVWLGPGTTLPDVPVLFLPAAALVSVPALTGLRECRETTTLVASRVGDAPVALLTATFARALWGDVTRGTPLRHTLARVLEQEGARVLNLGGWFARVRTLADARAAEDHLYAGLGSAIDTRLDRLLHRRLSRPLSRAAVALGVGPNLVSIASLLVGVAAAACVWRGTAWMALAALGLYLVSVVLDHVDGEVARLSLAESRLGEWLDVLIDTIVHALIAIAMGVTTATVGGGTTLGRAGALLGGLAATGLIASAALAKTSPPPSSGDHLGAFLANLGTRDAFYLFFLLYIAALAVAPALLPGLMVVVALGSHAFWLGHVIHRIGQRHGPGAEAPVTRP